jgi:hypothetical protein
MKHREDIITNYIDGYNAFDVPKMIRDFDETITFENISNGEINMSLEGLKAFMEQAEQTLLFFSERRQTIKSFLHEKEEITIEVDYYAKLAIDFPNGLKKGDELRLAGKSIFTFLGDKVIRLKDIS